MYFFRLWNILFDSENIHFSSASAIFNHSTVYRIRIGTIGRSFRKYFQKKIIQVRFELV